MRPMQFYITHKTSLNTTHAVLCEKLDVLFYIIKKATNNSLFYMFYIIESRSTF